MYKTIIVKYSPRQRKWQQESKLQPIKWNRKDLNLFLVLLHLLQGNSGFRQTKAPQPPEVCEHKRIK